MINLKIQPLQRAEVLGKYIVERRTTVRETARKFGISKSTVHKDVSSRLRQKDPALYTQVRDILELNKKERHIRGGLATKKKYADIAKRKSRNIVR